MKAQRFTLLIVDDSTNDLFFIARAFEKLGSIYKIQTAQSGREAVDYIEGTGKYADRSQFHFPSYIVTDLKMSDGDGFEILSRIRSSKALSIMPVIMLSGSADLDDIRQAYEFGASAYFVKPQSNDELHTLVRKIHDYWSSCEVPQVDDNGIAMMTISTGKASERFKSGPQ